MILYEFKCEKCRLRFEGWADKGKASDGIPCPSCKAVSQRHFGTMNFSFSGGKPTENNIDMLIGRESEKKWGSVNEDVSQRQKVRAETKEKFLMQIDRDTYRASTKEERESVRTTLNTYEKNRNELPQHLGAHEKSIVGTGVNS